MTSLQQIWALFRKDLLLELRQSYTFYGILLYVGATIFVLYMAIANPGQQVWNGLFWIIQLFICINAVAKSFLQESRGRMLYYQSIVNAQNFVLAKLLFNSILMLLMSGISLLLFMLFFGNPLLRTLPFVGVALLGGWSLSLVFSFLAAIAAKAQQNAAIMAILGFPLIIPQLLMLMQVSNAFFTTQPVPVGTTVLLLAVIDLFVIVLSTILFPFLWKD